MEGSGDNKWRTEAMLKGNVSFTKGIRNGAATSELRVCYDCQPKSLLAELVRCAVADHSHGASCVGGVRENGGTSSKTSSVSATKASMPADAPPVLVVQVGESRHHGNKEMASIQLITGRLLLRGETVHVIRGVPHYSENSQLAPHPCDNAGDEKTPESAAAAVAAAARPPALWGQPARALTNLTAASDLEGVCLFYHCHAGGVRDSVLQIGSRQTLIQDPHVLLSGRQHHLDSVARLKAASNRVRPAGLDELKVLLVVEGLEHARSAAGSSPGSAGHGSAGHGSSGPPPQRNLLLLAGRCLLRGDSIIVLSGLLHFVGQWYRVDSGSDIDGKQPPSLPRISGVNILMRRQRQLAAPHGGAERPQSEDSDSGDPEMEQAMISVLDRPLLLSNVWLYAQGGTVFVGKTPLLTDASLTVSPDADTIPLECQEQLLAQQPSAHQMRLFLQDGRFSLYAGGVLRATEGVAWLRTRKVRLGRNSSEQLSVRDALVFPQPIQLQDTVQFEGRDILYKDGLLYLDDLTPLLSGGCICLGQRELPLVWLSGSDDENRAEPAKVPSPAPAGTDLQVLGSESQASAQFVPFLTGGVCLLEPGGRLHLLHGRLHLPGEPEPIIIDQGVAHFAPNSWLPWRESAGFPPPMVAGRAMSRPRDTQQWAKTVDHKLDRATFEDANLSMCRGALWLNSQVPLLVGCRLLLNGRWFESPTSGASRQSLQLRKLQNRQSTNQQLGTFSPNPGFTGSYSVFTNVKSEALMFSLKARFADGLQFLFAP